MKTNLVALQIEFTNACALACAECPRYLMSRPVGNMDVELAKLLVREGIAYRADMGFNVNGLGEPLLYKPFAEMIRYMGEQNAHHVDLFTSLVAPTKLVQAAFDAFAETGIKVQLAITKHVYDGHGKVQTDDEEFDKHLEMALKLPGNVDRHLGIVLNKYHTPEDVERFNERYSQYFPPNNFHIIKQLNPWFNLVTDMASATFGPSPAAMDRNICDYPFILLHVGWNGDCIVCCTDDVDGELVLGTMVKEGDLRRIWEGEAYESLREKHRNYIIDMAPCNKCERTAWART